MYSIKRGWNGQTKPIFDSTIITINNIKEVTSAIDATDN